MTTIELTHNQGNSMVVVDEIAAVHLVGPTLLILYRGHDRQQEFNFATRQMAEREYVAIRNALHEIK